MRGPQGGGDRAAAEASAHDEAGVERMVGLIELIADEVGPRRPTGAAERVAANLVADELRARGARVEIEAFNGYSTFAAPFGVILGLGVAGAALPRSRPLLRALPGAAAAGLGALEDGLTHRALSRALSQRASCNLLASVEPVESPERTVCLLSHLDTSRSGWLFHPSLLPHLRRLLAASSAAIGIQALEPVLGRSSKGRGMVAVARSYLAASLALLAERELRGEDVPGANDNASGVALGATIVGEIAESPLRTTRVVMLATGCEESGVLGAEHFARAHPEAADWIYLNFDGVCAPATLRYLRREGLNRKWSADRRLIELCGRIARARPELGLESSEGDAGLTYDATPLLARDWRAVTLGVSNGVIPNYHWPTDTPAENLDRDTVARALEVGRELVAAIDRGEAD